MNIVHIDELTTRRWTHAEYAALEGVNWSTLKEMRRSPLHYKAALDQEHDVDSDALRLGRVVHLAVFEPDRLVPETAVWTSGVRRGKDWDAFQAEHAGKTIITAEAAHRAIAIRDAVRGCSLVKPYLATGKPEQVIQWNDRRSGLACKGRLDWLSDAAILDLKTARNATDPRAFSADAFRLGYFHQAEFYRRGVAKIRATAEGPPAFVIAVEPEPPHDVAFYVVSEDALHFVGEHIDELLAKVVACRATDTWPGTFSTEQLLDMPKWGYPSAETMTVPPPPAWLEGA